MTDTDTDTGPHDGAATFEETLDRLRQVVARLEGGSEDGDALPLEQSLALFEEGVGLAKAAAGALDAAEARVESLVADGGWEPLDDLAR